MNSLDRITRASRRRLVREPDFIALFDVQMMFQRVRKQSMFVIEVSEVRAVDGKARKVAASRNRR